MIEVIVNAEQLRKALVEIEIAEANGFMHCDTGIGNSGLTRSARTE